MAKGISWRVTACVRSVAVVLHLHIDRLIVLIARLHAQRCFASLVHIDGELSWLVDDLSSGL